MALNFQQPASPFARRAIVVALLVVSLVLVIVYAREGDEGPLHGLQSNITGVSGSVSYVGAHLDAGLDRALTAVSDSTASDATLSELREQNAQLREMVSQAEEYRQEVDRLNALLGMKQSSGLEGVGASIVGRSISAWDRSLTVNVGSDDGIAVGMAVVGNAGVIGQISAVSDKTATVRLLNDANSGAAVMVQSSRANGIVRGSIDGLLYLEDVDESELPSVGDVVVTSGLGGSYVSGLIVGTVVSVNASASNATGTIVVSQNGSVSALEEVLVVTGLSSDATAASSSDAA